MSDNSNNVHFSGVRFICSPCLAIKSALASLGPIMTRCGLQMNFTLLLYYIIFNFFISLFLRSASDNRATYSLLTLFGKKVSQFDELRKSSLQTKYMNTSRYKNENEILHVFQSRQISVTVCFNYMIWKENTTDPTGYLNIIPIQTQHWN